MNCVEQHYQEDSGRPRDWKQRIVTKYDSGPGESQHDILTGRDEKGGGEGEPDLKNGQSLSKQRPWSNDPALSQNCVGTLWI